MRAKAAGESPELVTQLIDRYHDIRQGIGAHKSVTAQGAFPTDPYSHTPSMMGAQQPGLTGQVKEDFIARLLELGVRVDRGCIRFDPFLLPESEYADGPLKFTFCTTPIELSKGDQAGITIEMASGETVTIDGLALDANLSRQIFERRRTVQRVKVAVI
jgi:hypothetical protein